MSYQLTWKFYKKFYIRATKTEIAIMKNIIIYIFDDLQVLRNVLANTRRFKYFFFYLVFSVSTTDQW